MSPIGIIAAMEEEICHLRAMLTEQTAAIHAGITFYSGHMPLQGGCQRPVVLAQSGIGKVNAALTTQLMIDRYDVDLIVNTGSAGGLGKSQQIGDFVVARQLCHHDIDVTLLGVAPGELPGLPRYYDVKTEYIELLHAIASQQHIPYHTGVIATGESFIYRPEQVAYITRHFTDVIACEMEAAAVAQVAFLNQVDVVVIRSLSDIAGQTAEINFAKYLDLASRRSSQLVRAFLSRLSSSAESVGVE